MKAQDLPRGLLALIEVALVARTSQALVLGSMTTNDLMPRQDSVCSSGFDPCGQGLPSNFCCKSGDTCLQLNNTIAIAAALCCPAGSNCNNIDVVVCDTKYQSPIDYPDMPLHTKINVGFDLPTCGSACCPLGYECASDGSSCQIKNETKMSSQSQNSSTLSGTASSSPTGIPTVTASLISSGTRSAQNLPATETNKTNTAGLVFAGLIPGLLVGSAVTFGILFWLRKRKKEGRGWKLDNSSSFFGPPTPYDAKPPKISEPIYQPGMSDRVVFGNARTASGGSAPDQMARGGDFYKPTTPNANDDRFTTDTNTLDSPPSTTSNNKKVRTLDPPFETPTKPGRSTFRDRDGTKSFFSRSSSRTSRRRDTSGTTHSTETITMTMSPPMVPSSYQGTPAARQTTYSDVYRAIGVSPSKMRGERPSEDTPR